jgi:NADH:ubiquinone oxidoreductase subunit H
MFEKRIVGVLQGAVRMYARRSCGSMFWSTKTYLNLNLYNMILNFILSVVLALVIIAFFTLAERKVIASVQRRKGPNVVGI